MRANTSNAVYRAGPRAARGSTSVDPTRRLRQFFLAATLLGLTTFGMYCVLRVSSQIAGIAVVLAGILTLVVLCMARVPAWIPLVIFPVTIPLGVAFRLPNSLSGAPILYADLAIGTALLLAVTNGTLRPPRAVMHASFALALWSIVCSALALDPHVSFAAFKTVIMAIAVLLVATAETRREPRIARYALASCSAAGVILSFEVVRSVSNSAFTLVVAAEAKTPSDIAVGASNYVAALLLLCAASAVMVVPMLRKRWQQVVAAWSSAVMLVGVLMTGSRTQSACFLIGIPLLAWGSSRRRQFRFLHLSAILTVISGVAWALFPLLRASWSPAIQAGVVGYRTFGQREILWLDAWHLALSHPIVGVGLQNLHAPDGSYEMAHNVFLQVLAETGFIGLALFLYLVWRAWNCTEVSHSRVTLTLFLLLAGASGFFEPTLRTREYDYVFWLIVGVVSQVRVLDSRPRRSRFRGGAVATESRGAVCVH